MPALRPALAVACVAVFAAACHSTKPPAPAPPAPAAASPGPAVARPPAPPPRSAAVSSPSSPAPMSDEERFRRESLDQLNADHPLGDAFFAYDSSNLTDQARKALQTDANWLEKWSDTAIRIEGHCDERGTAEYNLALGERRAGVVRSYLEELGVSPKRIAVVSLGKEAPFCTSNENESCWSQNRRGHFLITAK